MAKIVNNRFGLLPEKLSNASPSRAACAECALHRDCSEPFMKPYIPDDWTGKYVLVHDVSRDGEEGYARSGVGLGERERSQLKDVLKVAGVDRNDIAFVPVLRCRPILTGSKKPKMASLRACRPFLLRAIAELNPTYVLGCGDNAVKGLLNRGTVGAGALLRGRELDIPVDPSIKVFHHAFSTNKISALVVDPHASTRMIEDLTRLQSPVLSYPKKGLPHEAKEIGFDTEYSGTQVLTLGLADSKRAIALSPAAIRSTHVKLLGSSTLVGHNITVDLEALIRCRIKGLDKAMEIWLQGRKQRDTLLEARLADENRGKYGYKLESLAVSLFNVKDWKSPTEALGPDSAKWPPLLRDERCRLDAWATLKIHERLTPDVKGPSRLSHEIALSLRRMYWAGVYIDGKKFAKMRIQIYKDRADSLERVQWFAKRFGLQDFTGTKDAEWRQYLYEGVGLEVESYTKGGLPSVSAKKMKEFKDEKAVQAFLAFSKADKLQSTYCDSLAERFVKVGCQLWMPVSINPLAAKTGRRASAAPNFQNWPVPIRQIVVSRFQGGCIADNDYSKLEPIVGGWVANEPRLTDYFVKYPNGYIKIGEDFFKKSVEKNTKEYTVVKSLILGIIYNKKKWSLAEELWIGGTKFDSNYEKHVDEIGNLLERFLRELFPGVKRYHAEQEEKVLADGMVWNALGQCRRLPLPPEPSRNEKGAYRTWMRFKSHVINQAINYPIQSLASYVTGCGLIDVERAFLSEWSYSYVDYQMALMEKQWPNMPLLCIEVHDSLVQDIPKHLVKKTGEITNEIMCKPPSLVAVLPELFDSNVKLKIDTNVGPTWGLKS